MLATLLTASSALAEGADPAAVLAEFPGLVAQIREDATASRFAAWAQSTVIDEHTGQAVIPRSLFEHLHELAGLTTAWPVGNAGLIHVYGYLFSTADTPYGSKRDRWTGGGVARAFDLPADRFTPWSTDPGTPLARLADAMEPIVAVPGDYPGTVRWIEEASPTVRTTAVVVRGSSGDRALLYALNPGGLVTAFPISGESSPLDLPRLRYNAVSGSARLPLAERRVHLPGG